MKLAFCLFRYFPYGGLQRDFLEIASICRQRGHQVTVFTMEWAGPVPDGLTVHIVASPGVTNHGRAASFAKAALPLLQQGEYDAVMGFNKMPGLDVYYAADPCYQDKARKKYGPKYGPLYWLTPRFRHWVSLEKAVFSPKSHTQILLLSSCQQPAFIQYYKTPQGRFHHLPPGIRTDRIPREGRFEARNQLRREYDLAETDLLLIMVGSGVKGKGLDRALRAVDALPMDLRRRTLMMVIGQNKQKPFFKLAARLKIERQLVMLDGRDDIPRYLLGADLLIHPAYSENTGTVILEAMACGLPVLTTDVCGYASHVIEAKAGIVTPSPFEQESCNRTLASMLTSPLRSAWAENGIAYVKDLDLDHRMQMVATIIEETNWRSSFNNVQCDVAAAVLKAG